MMKFIAGLLSAVLLAVGSVSAPASQGSGCMPTSGTLSGLTLVQNINAANKAFITMNSGAAPPATDCTGLAQLGQMWLDTNTNTVKLYDGANWLPMGVINSVAGVWTPRIGGGLGTLTAATSTNLGSIPQGQITISGNTTIAGFGVAAEPGTIRLLKFTGTPTLTNSTGLILPTGADVAVQAGDQAFVVYLGGGSNTWSVVAYTRANGAALSVTSIFNGAVFLNSPISISLSAQTDNWNPAGLATANVIRVSATTPVYITGITAPASDGKLLAIYNTGANSVSLPIESTSSTAGNRFLMNSPFTLFPGRSVALLYDATVSRWRLLNEPTAQPLAGSFAGLKITNDPVAPTTTMRITADQLVLQDAYGRGIRLSGVSVAPSMLSSGANGLDTGAIVNNVVTWYYEFVIYNPAGELTAGLFSLQSSCASVTMPAGYTFCTRVGANRTDGAATARWMGILQYARRAQYVIGLAQTSAFPTISTGARGAFSATSAPTWSAQAWANFAPATASIIGVGAKGSVNGVGNSNVLVAPNASYTTSQTNDLKIPPIFAGAGAIQIAWFTLESSNIYLAVDSLPGYVMAVGWDDNL